MVKQQSSSAPPTKICFLRLCDEVQTDSDVNATTDEDPPSNDMEVVKDYVKRDYLKEYAFSMCSEQGTQLSKQQVFESIEIFFKESTRGGGMHVHAYIHKKLCYNYLAHNNYCIGYWCQNCTWLANQHIAISTKLTLIVEINKKLQN